MERDLAISFATDAAWSGLSDRAERIEAELVTVNRELKEAIHDGNETEAERLLRKANNIVRRLKVTENLISNIGLVADIDTDALRAALVAAGLMKQAEAA